MNELIFTVRVFDLHHLRILAPSALVFFCLFLLFLHLSGGARKMKKKQKETKEVFQVAKRRELIQKESGGGEHRTVSVTLLCRFSNVTEE